MRLNHAISPLDNWIYRYYRVVHGVRISLAFVLLFLFTQLLTIPESTWPLITLVVVMGPISYWGNVFPRALQRIMGTCLGAASGIVALWLQQYSTVAMLLWCALAMFVCGYVALGRRPYVGLLIGITLAVVLGAHQGEFMQAVWRSGDVVLGSVFALLCCSIYPQRAFTQWRLQMSEQLLAISKIHHTFFSPNVLERPKLHSHQQALTGKINRLRSLLSPAVAETRLSSSLFEAIQSSMINCLYNLEKLSDTYWSDRSSHFTLLNSKSLKQCHETTERTLVQLSFMLQTGCMQQDQDEWVKLQDVVDELKQLASLHQVQSEARLYAYVWLCLQLMQDLAQLRSMVMLTLNLTDNKRA